MDVLGWDGVVGGAAAPQHEGLPPFCTPVHPLRGLLSSILMQMWLWFPSFLLLQRLKSACRSDPNWGPALKEHRTGRYAPATSEDAVERCPLKEKEELKEEQKERKDDISLTIQGSNGSTNTHNSPNPSA